MPDYKEMYRKMVIASEAAINILIAAQRECEELYINSPDVVSSNDTQEEHQNG